MRKMTLLINGEKTEIENGKNISEILAFLGVESKIFAVVVNANLIKKEQYDSFFPNDGDSIELLQFMGGG